LFCFYVYITNICDIIRNSGVEGQLRVADNWEGIGRARRAAAPMLS